MNNRFYLNEEEKKRILQMHKPRLNQKIIEEQSLQDIQNIILDNGGYVGKLGADNKLGPDTLNAIYNSLTKGFAKNNTATAQGTSGVQGTSGTEGVAGTSGTAGVAGTSGTAGVAGTSGTAGVAGTSGTAGVEGTSGTAGVAGTSGTAGVAGTTTNQVKLLDRVPTNKEIRQGFRRRKKYNNRMDRQKRKQLDDLYNQYEKITGSIQKFGSRDDGSVQFKQQMATLENQIKTINAQIDKLETT